MYCVFHGETPERIFLLLIFESQAASKVQQILLLITASLTVMAGATIAPALPSIETHFDSIALKSVLIPLVLTLPALAIALSGRVVGYFIDRIGSVPVIICSLVVYALAGSSGLWVETIYGLLLGRLLLGVAVSGIMTGNSTLIVTIFDGKERDQFLGSQSAFMALGGVAFLLLGGFLANFGWRLPFLIYTLSILLVPGFFLFRRCRLLEGRETQSNAEEDVEILHYKHPIFVIAFIAMTIFYMVPVMMPFIVEHIHGGRPFLSGVVVACSTMVAAITSMNFARLRSLAGNWTITVISSLCFALGYIGISFSPNPYVLILFILFCGFGMGSLIPNLNVWLAQISSSIARGRNFGLLTSSLFLGQFACPLIFGPVSDVGGHLFTFAFAACLCGIFAILAQRHSHLGRSGMVSATK